MENFISSDVLKSENGKMIQEFVLYIQSKWPLKIPHVFVKFIADICKSSSVAGLLQVTNHRTLVLLKKFCLEEIDIRSPAQDSKLKYLNSELPTFWPQLVSICELNNSTFLPPIVKKIVLCLIKIRKNTFKKSPQRYKEDYFPYEKEGIYKEDPTQFYPNHPIDQYPKLYNVSGNDDKDHCHKNFSSHSDFIDGIFSIGCCCKMSITYGFELMCARESARHFFRFLICRRINFAKLEGIIEDFACGLHPYVLNREPTQFQYTRFLVDGSHWQGQRKLKKPDYSGKGGHLGCSSSYNFNAYKDHIETDTGALNSQGREQIHSILDKCSSSLRQTNYFNFMRYMRVFFAIRNLMNMNKL